MATSTTTVSPAAPPVSTPDAIRISCPRCRASITLTEAMTGALAEQARRKFDTDLEAARRDLREKAETWALEKASAATREMEGMRVLLVANDAKLVAAQEAQAAAVRQQRLLTERERELGLEVERKVQAEVSAVRSQAVEQADQEYRLKLAEKDETLAGLSRTVDELRRRVEQGSQQTQGEAQEVLLESVLSATFTTDSIVPVAKGVFGGDVLHTILGAGGQTLGIILWESKRTKTWVDGWLPKLRTDQRAAKADLSVIVTTTKPKFMNESGLGFAPVDGVWVTTWANVLPLAMALRAEVMAVAAAKSAGEGMATKAETMYAYLTGVQFRNRVSAVVERISEMKADLERERVAMTRMWAKREGQLAGAGLAVAGMFGDMEAIAGKAVVEVEGLALIEGSV